LAKSAIRYLANCPVTEHDVRVADDIYGPNLGSLKGKTVHRPSPHVHAGVDPVPPDILGRHRGVTLAIDIMFVNKIPFLVTLSRNLKFLTVEDLPNRQEGTVRDKLKAVTRLYHHRGFHIDTILADPEFEMLRPYFPMLNICGADEHVPDIERAIRTIKDRVRSAHSRLPFRYLPKMVVVRLVSNAVLWINALPNPNGVSEIHSPRFLLVGRDLTYDKHVRLPFGSYVQTHEEHTNDMRHRTLGAICLGPTGNAQGGHYFFSLTSGSRIIRHRWTSLPMPDDAIQRVNQIGRQQGMPSTVTFSDRFGNELLDTLQDVDPHLDPYASSDDSSYSSANTSDDDDTIDNDFYTDDDDPNNDDDRADPPPYDPNGNNHDLFPDADASDDASSSTSDDSSDDNPGASYVTSENTGVNDLPPSYQDGVLDDDLPPSYQDGVLDDSSETTFEPSSSSGVPSPAESPAMATPPASPGVATPPASTGVATPPASTGVHTDDDNDDGDESTQSSPRRDTISDQFQRAEDRGRRAAHEPPNPERPIKRTRHNDSHQYITAILLLFDPVKHGPLFSLVSEQMTAQQGVKRFGEAGEAAIAKELEQVLTRKVLHGVHANQLTSAQRQAALRYLMFLKEKRCGTIKGRGCADGRKQRLYKTKEETSSPTVKNEALFLSCLIDAVERRHVLVCDIPGAFMQADIDELVHVKLDGAILAVLLRIDATFKQFVTYERGKPVLYTELDKALYGTLQAALLFWEKLSSHLVDKMGFTINPYDTCVVNKVINEAQCTIAWYVDDLKISHRDESVVEDVFGSLESEFGREAPLTVTRGKIHNYLGMRIDYSEAGKVQFTMPHMTDEIIKQLPPEYVTGPSVTPAANHLFTVNPNSKPLSTERADLFHRMTAQLLYLCKRARPDLQTAVSFLTTRVQKPDDDDFKKLARCVRYLKRTSHYPLTLEANSMTAIKWWVDASYAVHPDMRSHTGGTMSLGKGSVYSSSIRQKMNTRSSTEAELVGVNDMMSMVLWTRNFLESQGYEVADNILYQDNESAILLEKNGQKSSTKRTRHIEIRYFFVTDNVKRGRLRIEYCPTGDMIADFFTKPLQGSAFRKMVKTIMNISDDIIDTPSQECVGEACLEFKNRPTGRPDEVAKAPRRRPDKQAVIDHAEGMPNVAKTYADVVRG
jgi:Reverse transcriptase (RNA-dependent DNA polymerase)